MNGIFNYLKKHIDRNSNRKSYVLKNGSIVGCPQETFFLKNKIIPMAVIGEKSNEVNKMALETAIRKDLIYTAKENKLYKQTPRGTNYFLKGDSENTIRTIVRVVGSVDNISAKEYTLRHLMEITEAEESFIEFNLFSFYKQSKKVVMIEKKEGKLILKEDNNVTELEISNFINEESTTELNEKIGKLNQNELRRLSLRTVLKKCDKCMYSKNCKIKETEIE